MSDNSKGRPLTQRPSLFRGQTGVAWSINPQRKKPAPAKGNMKGVDGIDRSRIDDLSERLKDPCQAREVWDE